MRGLAALVLSPLLTAGMAVADPSKDPEPKPAKAAAPAKSPFANNSGCSTENPPANQLTPSGGGTCAGDTRIISEATFGFRHKFYQGPKGGLRWGLQYSYFSKNGYSGANGIQPHAVDNMVWTSFRYYMP